MPRVVSFQPKVEDLLLTPFDDELRSALFALVAKASPKTVLTLLTVGEEQRILCTVQAMLDAMPEGLR